MDISIPELLTLAGIAVIAVVLWLQRTGRNETVTIEGIADAIDMVGDVWQDAQGYVAAAEQLWATGRLQKESRFHYVLDRLKAEYPDVDTDMLVNAIEAGVYFLRQAADRKAA